MAKFTRRKLILGGAAAATAAAAGGLFAFNIVRKRRPNVVFVIMDAVRRDRIGMKGPDGKSLTPFLDAALAGGASFSGCIAASSWTLPSVAAMVTSRIPIITSEAYGEGFANGAKTFVEILRESGYYTCAVVKNPWLPIRTATGDALPTVVTRGFDTYAPGAVVMRENPLFPQGIGQEKEFVAFPPAEQAVDEAARILDARPKDRRPFYLYLHLMNTHEPYSPSAAQAPLAAAAPPVDGIPDYMLFKVIRHRAKARAGDVLAEEDRPLMARAEALYNAAVASTDAAIAGLAEYLRRVGEYGNTWFVVTSDHGEEFGEHGWFGHALTLYQEVLDAPLLLWRGEAGPRVPQNARVSAIDIAPTILSLAGRPSPQDAEGQSLHAPPAGRPAPDAVSCTVFPALPQKIDSVSVSIISGDYKFISRRPAGWTKDPDRIELYHLQKDPGEQTNAAGSEEGARFIEASQRALRQYVSNAMRRGLAAGMTLDDETLRMLKSLGYFH